MNTYKVVTVHRTVHVYNVVTVEHDDSQFGASDTLVFRRFDGSENRFPLANVISYEITTRERP